MHSQGKTNEKVVASGFVYREVREAAGKIAIANRWTFSHLVAKALEEFVSRERAGRRKGRGR